MGKLEHLKHLLHDMGSVLIGLSGGTDSSFLAKVAHDTLGDRTMAVIASGPIFSKEETKRAQDIATEIGIQCTTVPFDMLRGPLFKANSEDRCYHCKKLLYTKLLAIASERGFSRVADGTHAGDRLNSRPGYRALQALGVCTPLNTVRITKEEIIEISKSLNLSTWDTPSGACLATRIPCGVPLTREQLARVERCETWMKKKGFTQVRIRDYFPEARIELDPGEFGMALSPKIRNNMLNVVKSEGFEKITLDLEGYKSKEKQ